MPDMQLGLSIPLQNMEISNDLNRSKIDNHIIQTAVDLQKNGKKVFFVSKDINARVKAQSLGLKAVDYEKQKVNIKDLYTGFREIDVTADTISSLMTVGTIPWNEKMAANEFLILHEKGKEESVLARYDSESGQLNFVDKLHESVSGIKPLNIEQRMAIDLLLDDSIHIVTLVGKAGTGKTLLAIAAGLHRIFKDNHFNKVLISRPVIPFGKDIGYLPGSKEEKLSHWMQPLHDNMEFIMRSHKFSNYKTSESLLQSEKIEVEALTYIRGRSLPHQYIIIDEAQNLSPQEIKTVVSRAGEGTKVILTGDPYQIVRPYLDSNSNGLTFLVEAFKGQGIYGHVLLEKSERSQLAELAAELL
jgi:PhoH-like ATPase